MFHSNAFKSTLRVVNSMADKTPVVDQRKCIGSGVCTAIAANTFKIVNGKSQVINPEGDPEDAIQGAIDGCPVQAIFWKKKTQ